MPSYLLEIGCEEIPAAFASSSAEYLKDEFGKRFRALNLSFSSIESGGTPRRFFVNIDGLSVSQDDRIELIMGPPASAAFDGDGNLTETAKKFAVSKGIDISSLKRVSTPKGDYLQGEKKTGGKKSEDILKEIVPEVIKNMPFPKSMKWGYGDFKFARPIHRFLSVFDGKTLEFELDGIKASNVTYGHRFLAPAPITVSNIAQYKEELAKAFVIVDGAKRKEIILSELKDIADRNGAAVSADSSLLDTVVNLTEYPCAVEGEFDKSFLKLPEETLVTSMKNHQKYFPVRDKSGRLLNKFIGISNIKPMDNSDTIRRGYERVLRARLNDALFFYNNDIKIPLAERAEGLKKVVYQEKLGTVYDKTERFKSIALYLADMLEPDKKSSVEMTASLCKADLLSETVYEFPELQGIMGSYYARLEGKDENIALGIAQHYQPRFAGDDIPETAEGRIVSVADKIDTIAGAFVSGMKPSGNLDPYGLRRSAISILSIIEKSAYAVDMKDLVNFALDNFKNILSFDKAVTADEILSFINLRWKQIITSGNRADYDAFDAATRVSNDPLRILNLAKALTEAKRTEEFKAIASSFKRINNILKKNNWEKDAFRDDLFESDEEKALGSLIKKQHIDMLIKEEKNREALEELIKFAPAVNGFFENVMVMAQDIKIRENRLSLIASLRNVFLSAGDLGAIAV